MMPVRAMSEEEQDLVILDKVLHWLGSPLVFKLRNSGVYELPDIEAEQIGEYIRHPQVEQLWQDHQELRRKLVGYNAVQWGLVRGVLDTMETGDVLTKKMFERLVEDVSIACFRWSTKGKDLGPRIDAQDFVGACIRWLRERDFRKVAEHKWPMAGLFAGVAIGEADLEYEVMKGERDLLVERLGSLFSIDPYSWPLNETELYEHIALLEENFMKAPRGDFRDTRGCVGMRLSQGMGVYMMEHFRPSHIKTVLRRNDSTGRMGRTTTVPTMQELADYFQLDGDTRS